MAGAAQQGTMLGQGVGAVQAAGGAREQQMQGVKDQGGFIDQQGNYVQAQLASTESDITQASTEEQARLTRSAQGTPDDPRYRPPAETSETSETSVVEPTPGTAEGDQMMNTGSGAPVQGAPAPVSAVPPPANAVQAPAQASPAPQQQGGINAAPPGGAPVNQAKPQNAQFKGYDQTVKSQMPGMADAQAQGNSMRGKEHLNEARQNMNPQQLQESQTWEKNFDSYQQAQGGQGGGGMMGQQGMMNQQAKGMMGAQQGQGNNQQAMAQNQAELTKQMGQAGAVRGSWKDAQGGGAPGGGVASMMGGGGAGALYGQGQAGIAQQGGLMGQNAPMGANQQQQADEMFKKKRQATMQGFAVGGA